MVKRKNGDGGRERAGVRLVSSMFRRCPKAVSPPAPQPPHSKTLRAQRHPSVIGEVLECGGGSLGCHEDVISKIQVGF